MGAHLKSLTALRFAAALLVFGFHAQLALDLPAVFAPAGAGYVGVSFFFVLSGFVLTWSRKPGETPGRFYWHRFARIWPLHALTTLLVLAAGFAPVDRGCSLISNLTLACGATHNLVINRPSWSLSAEAVFYLLFPLLVWWVLRRRRLGPIVCGVLIGELALGLALGGSWAYEFPLVRLGEFALGVIAATALSRGWMPPRLSIAASAVVGVYLAIWATGAVLWIWVLPFAAVSALLIASCARAESQGALHTRPWMVRLGQWSFAFYLLHWVVIQRIELDGVVGLGAMFAVTLLLSALLCAGFERPVERWLRGLARPRSLAPAPSRA